MRLQCVELGAAEKRSLIPDLSSAGYFSRYVRRQKSRIAEVVEERKPFCEMADGCTHELNTVRFVDVPGVDSYVNDVIEGHLPSPGSDIVRHTTFCNTFQKQ